MTLPTVLLPNQQAWLADRSRVRVAEKSRRIGWSWTTAGESVLKAGKRRGTNVWYVGYNKDMAAEFILDASDWARHLNIAASAIDEFLFHDHAADKHIAAFRLTFASGRRITALASRPANLRGKKGDVVIDEAAFHDDLAGLIKSALALLMWGGQVSIISTHNGEQNPFNLLIEECRAGKRPYSVHRATLDDALSQGLYERICLVTGKPWSPAAEAQWRRELMDYYGDDADEELLVIPRSGGGKYLHRDVIRACMRDGLPVLRLSLPDSFTLASAEERERVVGDWLQSELGPHVSGLPPHLKHFLGEDFGRSGDLTVLAPFTELETLTYRVPFLAELRNVPYEQQRQAVFWLCDQLPNFRHAAFDARGNGNYLAEVAMQRYFGRVSLVQLSQPWYLSEMPKLKAALEDRQLEIPQHADVLSDLLALELVNGIPKIPDTKNKGTDGKWRHGDAAMALALGWFACHVAGAPAGGAIQTRQSPHYQSLHQGLFGRLR